MRYFVAPSTKQKQIQRHAAAHRQSGNARGKRHERFRRHSVHLRGRRRRHACHRGVCQRVTRYPLAGVSPRAAQDSDDIPFRSECLRARPSGVPSIRSKLRLNRRPVEAAHGLAPRVQETGRRDRPPHPSRSSSRLAAGTLWRNGSLCVADRWAISPAWRGSRVRRKTGDVRLQPSQPAHVAKGGIVDRRLALRSRELTRPRAEGRPQRSGGRSNLWPRASLMRTFNVMVQAARTNAGNDQ